MPEQAFEELNELVNQLNDKIGGNVELVRAKTSKTEYRILAA
jgi:hypothetical protein